MRFRRKPSLAQRVSDPSTSPAPSVAKTEGQTARRVAAEAAAQQIAARWHALSADEQADIQAAASEQQEFMNVHGITGFHGCTRTWDTAKPSIPAAADIRAETELLRSVLTPALPTGNTEHRT